MKTLQLALLFGGIIHFGILVASALAPRALDWRNNLRSLPKLLRQMFWVYGGFVVLVIVCFGILTFVHLEAMAGGEPVARWVCGMIALFWAARLGVQWWVLDARPWLTSASYRIGYHLLTVAFVALTVIYGWAALFPNR